MFERTHRVRYSETDSSGHLSLASLIDYFQDCAVSHSNAAGYSHQTLLKMGAVWVLNTWQVQILRLPLEDETVKVITNPHDFRGFFAHRNFLLETASGERLAIADSLWTTVSPENGVPVHTPEVLRTAYGVGEALEMDYAGRKIPLPRAEGQSFPPIPVRRHMLDSNYHVNNAQYVRLASDLLPEDFAFARLRVEYRAAAHLGDELSPTLFVEDGRCVITLSNTEAKPYCVLEFSV